MLVKILEFHSIDLEQAECELIEYLKDGWEIKGQSESGNGFIHYTLVYESPYPQQVKQRLNDGATLLA